MKKLWKTVLILVCVIVAVIGVCKAVAVFQEKNALEKEKHREYKRNSTLKQLGNRSSGGQDANTAEYSSIMMYVRTLALGKGAGSSYEELNEEETKEQAFEDLKRLGEGNNLNILAASVLGADYLKKDEIYCLYTGTKINAAEMKERVESILFNYGISLYSLLINEEDRELCYTANLRIKLAGDGCMTKEEIVSELYDFVYEGEGIPKVKEELLAEEVTYDKIALDMEGSFSEEMFYFNDMDPVSQMVFLYLMPRYVVQFDSTAGSDLWNYSFVRDYEKLWNEVIEREIFSGILE